MNHIQFIPYR